MTERVHQLQRKAGLPRRATQAELPSPAESLDTQARALQRHTTRPQTAQRQVAAPALRAAALDRQEQARLDGERGLLQRQIDPLGAVAPLQRQPQPEVPARPATPGDWVTVMRARAEEVQGQPLDARAHAQFTALQRQVAQTLVQGFRTDRGEPAARYAAYGEHLATLQRHAVSAPVSRVVLGLISPAERLPLQRAADEALQRFQAQDRAALNFDTLQSLQRQLAELDAEATQPVLQRIQARRGGGNPLPEAVQRHLEQGLNHDLSRVRIHDDAEADKLAKGVNAIAFTTGTDIFFRSGHFDPNTRGGLELLAHEVTHTVQQSQGKVGPGVDPDHHLEQEAQLEGKRLASRTHTSPRPNTPGDPLKQLQSRPRSIQRQAAVGNIKSNPYATVNAASDGQFCKPYSPAELRNGTMQFDYLKAEAGLLVVGRMYGRETELLWRQYLAGGSNKRVEITRSSHPNIYKAFEAASANRILIDLIFSFIGSALQSGKLKKKAGSYPIKQILSDDELFVALSSLRYTLQDGSPGNLAGGFESGSDFGRDARSVTGSVRLTPASGGGVTVSLDMQIDVQDAIDLCPGAAGTKKEQLLTVPLSRLEKSGIAGDLGIDVSYPLRSVKRFP